MNIAEKRLLRDLQNIAEDESLRRDYDVKVTSSDNLFQIKFECRGPKETPYETGNFKLEMKVPKKYPYEPPEVNFETRMFHPNISPKAGLVCVDTLKENWRPIMGLTQVLLTVMELLRCPNPRSPLNVDAAQAMLIDHDQYQKTVSLWVFAFADGTSPDDESFKKAAHLVKMGLTHDFKDSVVMLTRTNWDVQVATSNLMARSSLLASSDDDEFPDIPIGA